MLNNWLNKDNLINLLAVFEHFGYKKCAEEAEYVLLRRENNYRVVINTQDGLRYYHIEAIQKKLSASDLIIEEVSKIEGEKNDSLWDKVDAYYNRILDKFKYNESVIKNMVEVALDYNHFLSYKIPFKTHESDLYFNLNETPNFNNRVFNTASGEVLFPSFNIQNEISGYFIDTNDGVKKYKESDTKNSLWFSNIPDKIEWIILFKDPKEALSFHRKFNLTNAVYIALTDINYETTKILFQINKLTKAKKIILSFTGERKIESYIRDLSFLSFMDSTNFFLKLHDSDIKLQFKIGEEKSFLKFYNSIKKFNQGLAKSFLSYNKILDQNRITKQSIILSKENDTINVRVPLEVNAIKYFVWAYHKNYLSKSLEILKPEYNNWFLDWEASKSITLKGKEEELKKYKIAL